MEKKNMFANHISDKDFVYIIYKTIIINQKEKGKQAN